MMLFRIIIKVHYLSLLIILAGILYSFAGSSSRTQFTVLGDGVSDSGVVNNNGIALAIKEFKDVKIFGDSIPDISLNTVASDIIQKQDTMIFFNADTVNNGIYYRKFTINQSALQPQGNSWVKFCDAMFPQELFFNIDRGNSGYLASYIRKSSSNSKRYLRAHNGTAFLDVDSTNETVWLFSSQCAMDNDTFLIMYSNGMSVMKISKIYSSGTTIRKIGESTIALGSTTPGNNLMTSTVSFDGSGTILACWNRGTVTGAKSLHFTFLNRALDTLIVNDSFSQTVGDTKFYYNNAAGVASYGIGQFAVFFWDVNALYLSRIRLNGGVAEKTTGTIVNGNMRFCTASSSDKYVYVMCKGDIDGNGISGIEGIRYPLINGSFGVGQKFSNSDPLMNIDISDQYSTMFNCTIDTSGTIGAVWKHGNRSKGSVHAYRGVRYNNGYWTSPVESLKVNYGDSIQYYPSEVLVSSESSWYVEDSIRMGCTIEACQNAQWNSFSDLPLLESLKTICRYYQYRVKINRKTGNNSDSLSTPVVSSVTVPWNVKPVIVGLDSIGIRNSIRRGVSLGTTFTVMSRLDTVYPFITLRDQDNGDLVRYSATWPASGVLLSYTSNGFERNVQPLTILPLPYDTVVSTQINVRDFQGWSAQSRSINLVSRNSLPLIKIKIKQSGKTDTILMNSNRLLELQEEDTLNVNYSVVDTNDVFTVYGKIRKRSGITYQTIDSTQTSGVYRLICRSIDLVDTAKYLVDVSDPDTSYGYRLSLVINHKPAIDSVSYMGKSAKNYDTIRINAGLPITFRVHVVDWDLDFWDTLHYSVFTKSFNQSITGVSAVNQFTFTPQTGDSIIRFKTADKYGRSDSIILFVKMPWLETDSVKNPRYSRALDTLVKGGSLIDRSMTGDTVVIPLLNTGNDMMHITGCMFRNAKNKWLAAIIGTNAINISNTFYTTVALKPMIAENLILEFSAYQLIGDSVEYDTVILTTDDPAHDTILIPVRFEYNDLPVILSIDPDYSTDRPYWALGKKLTMNEKTFPPHAAIQISFSEPMDSVSALNAITVYSVYDSLNQNLVSPIPVNHVWVQNYTKLRLVPEYTMSSITYGLKPPSGLFIATDSLALHITSALKDKAATPSGPNALDIKKIFLRSETIDTTFHMKVDSVDFTLIGITPVPGDSQIVSKKTEITLTFSAPIYAQTVDTSMIDNKTLIVSSRYNGGKQLVFDSIFTSTNSATFRLSRNLFYGDTVRCLYKSVSVRNISGYSIDKNRNGIPAADYDTLSSEDDVLWQYKVKDIKLLNVSPINGSISNSISPSVVLTFSEPVWSGSFDTSLQSGNRSVSMRSVYSSRSGSFASIQYSADSTRITLQPNEKYYSDDSISCLFSGFSKMYSYDATDNLPRDTSASFSYCSWYFLTSNTGFYTFPNPYKPGKDPRHCRANGPCGIWFKNLHSLRRGVNDIAIKIYDMNANVLFDTNKKIGLIHFETGNSQSIPQWLWDTRNMKGDFVASGLYMYAVFDKNGKLLVKDKLVIVR